MIVLEEIWLLIPTKDNNPRLTYVGRIEIPEDEFQAIFEDVKKDTKDKMGYRKYKKVLKEKGFDIE